jgi:hypothetical protein
MDIQLTVIEQQVHLKELLNEEECSGVQEDF